LIKNIGTAAKERGIQMLG